MMALQDDDVRIAFRLPKWLYDEIARDAEANGLDISKEMRFELASLRGKAKIPRLPSLPTHDGTARKRMLKRA